MYLYDTELEILVNGKPVKKSSHEGRTYIQANKGSNYSIKIKNNSWNKRLFVCSVDGINVVDGKAAGSSKAGYVLNGYSSYEVVGFRTSNEVVHPFKFNDKQVSYAAKSDETNGDTSSCGVIGVQVYDEYQEPQIQWNYRPRRTLTQPEWEWTPISPIRYGDIICKSNGTAIDNSLGLMGSIGLPGQVGEPGTLRCANFMSSVDNDSSVSCSDWMSQEQERGFNAGTEFSKESVTDRVTDSDFKIGNLLTTIEVFYAYRQDLVSMGVPITKEVKVSIPSAFPSKFCKPPRN